MKTVLLHPMKVGQPYNQIGMDIVSSLPLTKKGNQHIVMVTKYLMKWPKVQVLPDAKAASVVAFFYKDIICHHGSPKELLTNQEMHFVNKMLNSLCQQFGLLIIYPHPIIPKQIA